MAAVRVEQVQRVLGEVLQWANPADVVLSHWLRANPQLGGRDRSELAEYLCADRSAVSRELSAMARDGLIEYNKNNC